MNRLRSIAASLVAPLALGAATLLAQSYGDHDQTLTVGAAAFEAENSPSGEGSIAADGYLYVNGSSSRWAAPLSLPDGAWLEEMCAYVNDDTAGLLAVSIIQKTLVGEGEVPFSHTIVLAISTHSTGYTTYCAGGNLRLRNTGDPDGDGTSDAVDYWIEASTTGLGGFGGVRIAWKREVSPPPPAPTFGDVPESDGAFLHIEALAASGITAGCGGGNYCPDAMLTRRQMAVFLAKALGLQWNP
jgi:hypothetical protein